MKTLRDLYGPNPSEAQLAVIAAADAHAARAAEVRAAGVDPNVDAVAYAEATRPEMHAFALALHREWLSR